MPSRRCPPFRERLDVLADAARLLLVVPHAGNRHRPAHVVVGEERLAEAALVVGDQPGGGSQDVALGAVVALQADDGRAREILLEAQDVVDLRAAPAIDRLVVVADAADIGRAATRQQPQPQILGYVGVLVLVDQDVAEAALIVGEDVGIVLEQAQHLEQQVAEVGRVQLLQALLVGRIELRTLALGETKRLPARHLVRGEPAVLPAVEQGGELARRPAVLVQPLALDDLLDEADLVVGVEDREARFQAHQLGMPAQDLDAHGVERAEPRHAFHGAADQHADALLHLARGLVGEGHGQDLRAVGTAGAHYVGDTRRQHARLAGAGAGQHQNGPVQGFDGGPLLGIEAVHIGCCSRHR